MHAFTRPAAFLAASLVSLGSLAQQPAQKLANIARCPRSRSSS
jgi:hypothetical protein